MLRSQYSRLVVPLLMLALSIGAATSALGDSSKTPVAPVNAAEGIGVKGYDPVAYFVNGQPTKGAEQYAFVRKGVTYRFSSADNLNLFKSAPAKYLPQYGGYCAYAMSLNRIADISPSEWAIVDGKLYLNNGVFSQSLWSLNKSGNIASTDGVSGVSLERPEFRIKLTQGPYLSLERRNVLSAPDRYGLREALQAIVETEEISR